MAHGASKFSWSGDLRVRAQLESTDLIQDRLSGRIRARVGAEIVVDPEVKGVFRLATTRTNRAPNQVLGESSDPGSARRFFGLDLAYGEWTIISGVKLHAGRIPQTQIKVGGSQIILDDDIALEGLALSVTAPMTESLSVSFLTGSDWIRENYDTLYSVRNAENMINWAQVAGQWKIDEGYKVRAGLGFHNFTSLEGMLFSDLSVGGSRFGNTERTVGVVKNQYLAREYFAEWTAPLGSMASLVAIQHVVNTSTRDLNQAWWVAWSVVEPTVWDMQLGYGLIESDAVPGVFTDSDFANGSTDSDGFLLSSRWFLGNRLQLRLSQFYNRIERSSRNLQYLRTHLDLSASF